ncbi:LytR/AlgR family response regulator transcription factor [Mucilaginibacter sp. HD30]
MSEKLTCYIIDDEYLAQEILEAYIAKVPFLELKGTFMSPLEAAGQLAQEKPDLLFLDINMPDLDGLSFIPMLKYKPMIILTTAYDQYALKAYELEVKDYLVKPFPFEKFYKVVLRLYQEQNTRPVSAREDETVKIKNEPEYLFLKVGHRIQKIAIGDILFIEAMKDYLRIHMVKENVMALLSFAKLEELLPAANFVRVHRSFMVAVNKIDHIEKNRIKIGEDVIPVSESYADQFYSRLKGLS